MDEKQMTSWGSRQLRSSVIHFGSVVWFDPLKSINWPNEDYLIWPGWGVRTRSGAIRQTFEAISTHLGKSISILNKDLFGQRFGSLFELMPFRATLDGRNEGRSREARDVNNALQAVHGFGDEVHVINRCRGFFNSTSSSAFDFISWLSKLRFWEVCSVTLLCSATIWERSTGRRAIPIF